MRIPILDAQQEYILATHWLNHGDDKAAHQLVASHLRLVAKIAMKYRGYGLPMSDIVSEGNIGLMHAVKRFDPHRGIRLATYALWWIRAGIQQYILRSWSLVKLGTTASQKKLFFNLRRAKNRISAFSEGDMRADQVRRIAIKFSVTEQDVIEMNRRFAGDTSLNAPEGKGEMQDWLADEEEDQEQRLAASEEASNRRDALIDALNALSPRERRIFEARRLTDNPPTLDELSYEFRVSRERIRQIEAKAFEKVRDAVKSAYVN
jgi:RNA polymerase sigma-32 factor